MTSGVNSMVGSQTSDISDNSNKKLDLETENFLKEFSNILTSISNLPIPEQRETIKKMAFIPEDQREAIAMVEDKLISGKNGPINIRIYSPKDTGPLPVIVYFHSGGWVYGSIEESEATCRRLANETASIVVAVDYRLAPENKFPIPLEDCYDATKWVVDHASTLKVAGDPKRVALCGESSGGNLAAAVALMCRDKKEFSIAAQLLVYPVLTSDLEKKHYEASPDKSLLSFENMQFFLDAYLSSAEEGENPYASPLKSKDSSMLPPCFIVTAEHDALKHEGQSYGENLQSAGIEVQIKCYPEVIHGFLGLPISPSTKKEAIEDIGVWAKRTLQNM